METMRMHKKIYDEGGKSDKRNKEINTRKGGKRDTKKERVTSKGGKETKE